MPNPLILEWVVFSVDDSPWRCERMLNFCLRSLFTEYGWQFLWQVALPHPVKTTRAVLRSSLFDCSGDFVSTCDDDPEQRLGEERALVGLGFCLKPMNPACVSGRFNHDCHYLENLLGSDSAEMPECCRQCAIREIGIVALRAGVSVYIMTSAKDILFDVFAPSLKRQRFASGLFVLCRYSLRPFAVGLNAAGVRGWMIPFGHGDCANYRTWLMADRGVKDDQTSVQPQSRKSILQILSSAKRESNGAKRFVREGNVLRPEA
jgi:hypothetical protein